VQNWRRANPEIVAYWARLDDSAKAAVRNPGTVFQCLSVAFEMRDQVLFVRLPSGRELCYPSPTIKPGKFGRAQIVFADMKAGRRRGKQMYGGQWTENVTQAVARVC
jgi:DNA polymerase